MQIFLADIDNNNAYLTNEEHKHATKVLRKVTGDKLYITDGKGKLYLSELTEITSKKSFLTIISLEETANNNHLHIAIAPTKNISRFEFFLEKATEIGINEITPLLCDHSERKIIKNDRLEKILISAMKQSKNFHMPILNEMIKYNDFINSVKIDNKYIAHCEGSKQKNNFKYLDNKKETVILIGPEGDFSPKEIELAKQKKFKELSLGDTRLRTETAGIVATTLYNIK
jgi:16S rRNA (uracil1498-N3)-methyltransferase